MRVIITPYVDNEPKPEVVIHSDEDITKWLAAYTVYYNVLVDAKRYEHYDRDKEITYLIWKYRDVLYCGDIKKDDFWKPIRKFIKKGHAGDSQIFFNKNGDKTFGIRLEKNEWEYTKKKWLFFPKLYLELSICYEVLLVFFLIYTFAQNGFRLSYAEIEDHAKIACVPVALPVAVIALPYAIYDEVKKQIKYYEEEQKRFYDLTHDADTTIYYNELVKKNEK